MNAPLLLIYKRNGTYIFFQKSTSSDIVNEIQHQFMHPRIKIWIGFEKREMMRMSANLEFQCRIDGFISEK